MSSSVPPSVKITVDEYQYDLADLAEYNLADLPDGILLVPETQSDPLSPLSVEVTDDPRLVDWVRKAYAACFEERFVRAVSSMGDFYVNSEDYYVLEERSALAANHLRQIMNNPQPFPRVQAKAAQKLAALGQKEGTDFLLSRLNSSTLEECTSALEILYDMLTDNDSTLHLDANAAQKVLALVSSPDSRVSSLAAKICDEEKVQGLEQALQAAVEKGESSIGTLADLLVRNATTSASIELALPHLFKQPSSDSYSRMICYGYEDILGNSDPAISEPLRRAGLEAVLNSRKAINRSSSQAWVQDLCLVADETVLPILEDIIQSTKDNAERRYALEAMARIRPELAVKVALTDIEKENPGREAIAILRKYASEADLDRIFALLYENDSGQRKRELGIEDAQLLLERFCSRGKNWLTDNRARFSSDAYIWAHWQIGGLKVHDLLADMRAAGIVQQSPEELLSLVAARRRNSLSAKEWYSTSSLILETLTEARLCTGHRYGYGIAPPDNALYMQEFAKNSAGRFQLECPIQIYQDPNWNDDERDFMDPFYTVCFIYLGRLYRFLALDMGDLYSTSRVVEAMNTALRLSGRPERYIGHFESYIFADPDLFRPIAQRYALW
jgi:hypothetical protein